MVEKMELTLSLRFGAGSLNNSSSVTSKSEPIHHNRPRRQLIFPTYRIVNRFISIMKRRDFARYSSSFVLGLTLANCAKKEKIYIGSYVASRDTKKNDKLQIWWEQGFYKEEDQTIKKVIADWEAKTGNQVELTLIPQKDIKPELERAIASKTLPDILDGGITGDLTLIPRMAQDNLLADVSEVIEPQKNLYFANTLLGIKHYNKATNKRSYYAVPIMQTSNFIHYWKDTLEQMDIDPETIPTDWDGFWQFWINVQPKLSNKPKYSLGLSLSPCFDTHHTFEQFLEAYDVRILDESGQLVIDPPQAREGMIQAMEKYASFWQKGAVPPDAVNWDNTGNNVSILSRNSLMTINNSLSIPGSQKKNEDVYYNRLATINWPKKPNGQQMKYISNYKQVSISAQSNKQKLAKDFLSYLSQPQNLQAYVEGSQGRYQPVMASLLKKPFWQSAKDSHLQVGLQQAQNIRTANELLNPTYGEVGTQQVWGNSLRKIAVDNISPSQAINEAIAQIQQIFATK